MAEDPPNQPTSPSIPPNRRRSSFAGQTFADLFGTGQSSRNALNNSPPASGSIPVPVGPITTAAAQAQRRRMSLTTLGLGTSPVSSRHMRGDSLGSSIDESAVEDEVSTASTSATGTTPFSRRMSFGARALQSVRTREGGGSPTGGGAGSNGTHAAAAALSPAANGLSKPASSSLSSPSSAAASKSVSSVGKSRGWSFYPLSQIPPVPPLHFSLKHVRDDILTRDQGEGFNWSENFRTRAERTSSISSATGPPSMGAMPIPVPNSATARSVSAATPATKVERERRMPDAFQERILKGDFYMD